MMNLGRPGDITHCTKCEEDPFMWIDHRGHWHVLCNCTLNLRHNLIPGIALSCLA